MFDPSEGEDAKAEGEKASPLRHTREGGYPVHTLGTLDSRMRGNDEIA